MANQRMQLAGIALMLDVDFLRLLDEVSLRLIRRGLNGAHLSSDHYPGISVIFAVDVDIDIDQALERTRELASSRSAWRINYSRIETRDPKRVVLIPDISEPLQHIVAELRSVWHEVAVAERVTEHPPHVVVACDKPYDPIPDEMLIVNEMACREFIDLPAESTCVGVAIGHMNTGYELEDTKSDFEFTRVPGQLRAHANMQTFFF